MMMTMCLILSLTSPICCSDTGAADVACCPAGTDAGAWAVGAFCVSAALLVASRSFGVNRPTALFPPTGAALADSFAVIGAFVAVGTTVPEAFVQEINRPRMPNAVAHQYHFLICSSFQSIFQSRVHDASTIINRELKSTTAKDFAQKNTVEGQEAPSQCF